MPVPPYPQNTDLTEVCSRQPAVQAIQVPWSTLSQMELVTPSQMAMNSRYPDVSSELIAFPAVKERRKGSKRMKNQNR